MKYTNTVIIRTHDKKQIDSVIRAVQTVYAMDGIIAKPLIACQARTFGSIKELNRRLKDINHFEHMEAEVIEVDGEGDIRSKLINSAILKCYKSTDYISFLDCDDTLTRSGVSKLIETCEVENVAIAFGKVALILTTGSINNEFNFGYKEPFHPESKIKLLHDNTQPIHSYVLSTKRINIEDMFFREEMTCLEDYEFLLRIISKYPSSFTEKETLIGMYYWRSDGTNTTNTTNVKDKNNDEKWKTARTQLKKYRSCIQVNWFANDY